MPDGKKFAVGFARGWGGVARDNLARPPLIKHHFPKGTHMPDFNFSVKDPDSETTYTPWTDGHAVGFRCERNGKVEYIYLQPSDGSDDGVATVFPYQGPTGEAGQDDVAGGEHYVILDDRPTE